MSKGLCIQSHQGRKTFAAFVLEIKTSQLKAVSQHFKHRSIAQTEAAYFPPGMRFKGPQQDMQRFASIGFFVESISGLPLFGRMGESIKKFFASKDWSLRNDLVDIENAVTSLVDTHDLRIYFSAHGNCLLKANPAASRCRQSSENQASWHTSAPDFSVRTPTMCAGCACFVMDASHLPYWTEKAADLTRTMCTKTLTPNSQEFRVIKARADTAVKVVKMLQGKIQQHKS